MAKAEVTLKLSPTELDVIRQSLFAYEEVLRLPVKSTVAKVQVRVLERYGTGLTDILPTELRVAVRKVINSLH